MDQMKTLVIRQSVFVNNVPITIEVDHAGMRIDQLNQAIFIPTEALQAFYIAFRDTITSYHKHRKNLDAVPAETSVRPVHEASPHGRFVDREDGRAGKPREG